MKIEANIKTVHNKIGNNREILKEEWLKVWKFYQDIKTKYNLTAHDILKQLNIPCYDHYLQYLSPNCNKIPLNKPGLTGREIWDLFLPGLNKTEWLPAVKLTYVEKYTEMYSDGCFSRYSIKFINEDPPIIEVGINHDQYYNGVHPYHDKNEIASILTIDGIVPEIREITNFYWC